MADLYIKSPLEHGELDSPEYSPTNSPELVVGVAGEEHSDERDDEHSPRYQDEEELGPDIKPPQAKVKKDKHKSHKRDKHKTRDRDKSDRYGDRRSDRGTKSSDAKRSAGGASYSRSQRGEASSHRERGSGSGGPVRGTDRRGGNSASQGSQGDRPVERERPTRDDELSHRDRSNRERERLERLEMERQRLDREIIRHEQQQRDKLQREQAERDRKQRSQIVRVKPKQSDGEKSRGMMSSSSRQMDQDPRRGDPGQGRSAARRSRSPQNRRPDSQGNRTKERPVQMSQRNESSYPERGIKPSSSTTEMSRMRSDNDGYSRSKTGDREGRKKPPQKPAECIVVEIHSPAASEESDSDSDSSSSGDSDSDSDSDSEEDENKENHKSDDNSQLPERVKSRFDSASENEAEASDRGGGSEHSGDQDSPGGRSDHGGDYNDYLDETPPQSPVELLPDLPPYLPAIQGCRNVDEFNCLHRIEEGTYGVVYQALDKKTDEVVALKRLKMEKEKEGFPITSLREINTLLKAQHPNIVTVREIVVGSNMDRIYIVMDYVEHDLKSLMEHRMKEPFTVGEVKTLLIQLLRGVGHLHDNWIIHRDLKTSNLLLSHAGILKIADFGLAREYGSPLKAYTPIVVTLWYRAPELLLGTKEYSCPIDMWSVGCIMAEFLTKKPLFPGKSEIDELNRIFKELGTPNEKIWPGVSELKGWKTCTFSDYPYNQLRNKFGGLLTDKGFELMNRFLTYNPAKRIVAEDALKHPWFHTESPSPVDPSMFPTWPTKGNEHHHKKSGGNSPKPPSGGKAYSSLLADDSGFHLPGVASGGGFALKF